MNRDELRQLSELRLVEAEALLAAGHSNGAYYLTGYSVECALKSTIAGKTKQFDFPERQRVLDSYVHDLEKLVKVAQLSELLTLQCRANPVFERNWDIVKEWSESSRYSLSNNLAAATALHIAVVSADEGVLPWIMQY